uniref:Uncharacterized protein n=1 Tax=Anopheles dirus TaxID=7168 RepID=A0A182NT03_9DIPT
MGMVIEANALVTVPIPRSFLETYTSFLTCNVYPSSSPANRLMRPGSSPGRDSFAASEMTTESGTTWPKVSSNLAPPIRASRACNPRGKA